LSNPPPAQPPWREVPAPPTNEPFGWWALFEDNEGTRYALEQSPSWWMNTGCSYIPWCRAAAADV
jgi:hypothetical protein